MSRVHAASKAFAIHLSLSAVVAALAATLVLGVWFPAPYRSLAGGLHLFWLVVIVDVVCGPLLTAVLYNPRKSRLELTLDLSLVALVQLAALIYGLYSVALARPVALVHEVDRFVAVTQAQIDPAELQQARPEFRNLSWFGGPRLLGTRQPRDGAETLESVELSINGQEPSLRPGWWQAYADSVPEVKDRMKPLAELHGRRPADGQRVIDETVEKLGQPMDGLFYLPLTSQKSLDEWIVLLDEHANIVGHAPVDGF